MEEFEITASNGKTYKSLRAYHIALGHAVRQALINFAREIEDYCIKKVEEFYAEYTPNYYERTYQLIDKMELGQLIKTSIRGNFQGNATFIIDVFDWGVLDAHANAYGTFGTYTSFDGSDARGEIEEYLQNGIYGHDSFDLRNEVNQYVEKNLDRVVQETLDRF